MNKNRLWIIGSVLVMVVVLVGGVLLGVQPQLAAAAAANEQRATVEASNAGQAAVLEQLKKDFEGIDTLKAELAPLSASVPSGTRMPAFVKQLDALAGSTSVTLDGFTVSDAAPYTPVAAPAAVADPAADADPGADPAAAPAATPAEGQTLVAGLPPVTSDQITTENFASLSVTVTVTGSYANALDFVNGLQNGERLFLVTGLTTTAKDATNEESGPQVTAAITGLVYVLVPPAGAAAAPVAG